MNSKKNYTIVFQNEKKSKHTLQRAGKNLLNDDTPSISDYYNHKFKKDTKPMDNIIEEDNDDDLDHNT